MSLNASESTNNRILITNNGTELNLPYNMEKEVYLSYIETLLKFMELNEIKLVVAKNLFKDATKMLGYHKCNFSNVSSPKPFKAAGEGVNRIKFAMYQEHDFKIFDFVHKYTFISGAEEPYYEMLLQLEDFINEHGLTASQAENLYSDCKKMISESK